jgi:hypothetical protein
MPYIITKTNGTALTTIDDASLDTTTDLQLVGRNYSGYGQVQNENFVKILENFSNPTAPANPIQGQLWYDNINKKLNAYDGTEYKKVANLYVQKAAPTSATEGDLWWDSTNQQLSSYNGASFRLVGPPSAVADKAFWVSIDIVPASDSNSLSTVLTAKVSYEPVATLSVDTFQPTNSILDGQFPLIHKGITLYGANAETGISSPGKDGYLLWGTAAHALLATTATHAISADNSILLGGYAPSLTSLPSTVAVRDSSNDIYANIFQGTASQVRYADLAERYHADAVYEVGTVLVLGGVNEVTTTNQFADTRVAGIVSTNPAYMMNSEAGNDETHPYIALKGRVPCKVTGYVEKGDLLVTSSTPGYATVAKAVHSGAVIGKALGSQSEGFGVIEVLVV